MLVGGLTGTTDKQKLDLQKAMLSRMTAIPRPSSILQGRRAPELIVSDVQQVGISSSTVDLSHYRTPTGEINLLTLAEFLNQGLQPRERSTYARIN